jgi:hypothetical protein
MSDTAHDAHTNAGHGVPDRQGEPQNPYFVALWMILGLCVIVGVILLAVGTNLAQSYMITLAGSSGSSGLGQIVWGASLLGVAVTAFLVMLGAAAARWQP